MKKYFKKYFKQTFLILLCLMFVSSLIFVNAITTKIFETDAIKGIRTAHYQQSHNLVYKDGFIIVDEDVSRKNFTIRYLDKEGKELNKKEFTNKYTTIIETDGEYLYLDVSDIPQSVEKMSTTTAITSLVKLNENLEEVGKVNLDGLGGAFYDPFYLTNVQGPENKFLDSINTITGRYNFFHFNDDGSILVYTNEEYSYFDASDELRKCEEETDGSGKCQSYDYYEDKNGVKYGNKFLLINKEFNNVEYIDPTTEQRKLFNNHDNETEKKDDYEKLWYSVSQKDNYTLKAGLYYGGPNFYAYEYDWYYEDEEDHVDPEALLTLYDGKNEKFTIQTKDYERFYSGAIMDDYIVVYAQKDYDYKLDTLVNDILVYDFDGNLVDKITDMTSYNQLKVEGNGFITSGMYAEGCKSYASSTEGRPDQDTPEDNACDTELRHVYYKYKTPEDKVIPPDTADISLILLVVFGTGVIAALIIGLKKYNFIK